MAASTIRARRTLGVIAALCACGTLAVAVPGCGASSLVDPVARAATVSNGSPGMRMNFLLQLSTPALPAPITATGNGAFDAAAHSGSVNMAMNFANTPQVAQALGSSTLRLEEIFDGLNIYLKLPPALAHSAGLHGKPWMKINLATAGRALGVSGLSSLLRNPTSSDPSQFLRYLRATSGGVTRVGTASVDGFQTTHYRAQIDLDRVANTFPSASRAQVRQTIASIEQLTHVHLLPMNVWVDGQHLVRRMEFSFDEALAGQSLTATMRIDIPQYGPQQPPQLPPVSEVTDISSGLGASGSTGGSPAGS